MARRTSETSKSERVRQYLKGHRRAGPAAVVKALADEGVEVSSQLVSNVKLRMRRRKGRGRGRPANGRVGRQGGSRAAGSYQPLFAAKAFVDKAGSVEKARAALDALARLQ
jgi:hypothetical protein